MATATQSSPCANLSGKRFRLFAAKGLRAKVDREKRIIEGCAIITRGEALGHGMWVDSEFLDQVVAAGNAAAKGVKSRFTHPGLCSDGLGKYLGRYRNFTRDDDIVRADLHLSETARQSPTSTTDQTEYLMKLAAEDPEAFGNSIVFYHDVGAEDRFIADNEDEEGDFTSPDKDNEHNYFHCRLASLEAADVVDSPAANPAGFFGSGDERAAQAEQVLSWIFGVSDVAPAPEALGGGQPDRIREFVNSFLARHGLEVHSASSSKLEAAHMDEKEVQKAREEAAQQARAGELSRLKALKEAFSGDEKFAMESFEAGLDLVAAQAKFCGVLQERLTAKESEIAKLQEKLTASIEENTWLKKELGKGETDGVAHGAADAKPSGFMSLAVAYQREKKTDWSTAWKECQKIYPKEYQAYCKQQATAGAAEGKDTEDEKD